MLRIRREDIKKAGRWVKNSSKMEYYGDDPSYHFAVQMGGFLGGQVPFHLKRNEISPTLELQQQIFTFIETAFGPPGSSEYDAWKEECIHEMEERNANDSSQLSSVLPLQYDPNVRGYVPSTTRQSDLAKQRFLKALLRLRRVILQDAAEYLCKFTDAESPLLAVGVFKTPAFQAFKEQVKAALSSKEVALPADMHPNVKMVLQEQQQVLVRQGEMIGRLQQGWENMGREMQGSRRTAAERLDQAMVYMDARFDCGIGHFKDSISRVESKLDYLISRLGPPGSALPSWLSYSAPSCSCQHAFGSTPTLAVSTASQVHSEQSGPSYPRMLAQAPVTALGRPRWTPVAQPQRISLQAVPVSEQQ